MSLSPELLRAVGSGRKTQMRRLIKVKSGSVCPCPCKPGRDYKLVSSLERSSSSHIVHVTGTRRELVGDIVHADAKLEGHRNRAEFSRSWVSLHDRAWYEERTLADELPGEQDVADRFILRHGQTPVWVITFELNGDPVHLLAARSELGYTSSSARALNREPEAIDDTIQSRYSEEGRLYDEARRSREYETLLRTLASLERAATELAAQHADHPELNLKGDAFMIAERHKRVLRKLEKLAPAA